MTARSIAPFLIILIFSLGSPALLTGSRGAALGLAMAMTYVSAVTGWLFVRFGMLRQSPNGYTAGIVCGFMALLNGLTGTGWLVMSPDVLLGLGTALVGGQIAWSLLANRQGLRLESAGLVCVLAVAVGASSLFLRARLDLASRVHTEQLIFVLGLLLCLGGGCLAFLRKQPQRGTITGRATAFFLLALTAGLAATSVKLWSTGQPSSAMQIVAVASVLLGLLIIGTLFTAEVLQVELKLRSGTFQNLEASMRDALTGIANRRALEIHGPQLVQVSYESGRAVSLIIADIDHFKTINDTYGHLAGDQILASTAGVLARNVRQSDLVARYGGEEFVIVLPGAPLAPAMRLAEKMRTAIETHAVTFEGRAMQCTASFGVFTGFPEDGMSLSEMLSRADANLYRAKHAGRNRVMTDALPDEL